MNIILDEVDRLDNLSRELLDFSGSTYLKLEEVDINAIMQKVEFLATVNRQRASIEILLDLHPELPTLTGDSEILIHAFLNLALNAMDAIAEKGFVRLATTQEGNNIVVKVSDNGSGLGLSIVHNIINEHGGHIEVSSRLGEGTTFTVKLPLGKLGAGLKWKSRKS